MNLALYTTLLDWYKESNLIFQAMTEKKRFTSENEKQSTIIPNENK
jgi:hypothetical protein